MMRRTKRQRLLPAFGKTGTVAVINFHTTGCSFVQRSMETLKIFAFVGQGRGKRRCKNGEQ